MQSALLPYYLAKLNDYFQLRGCARIEVSEKREEYSLSHQLFQYQLKAPRLPTSDFPIDRIFLTHVVHPWQQSCYVSFTFKNERDPRSTVRLERAEDLTGWLKFHFERSPKWLW